jgi:drug/metabolite transporter (DMT)-like permease
MLTAICWMVGSLLSFSLIAVAGREASRGMPTNELMFWRALFGTSVLLFILFASGGRFSDLKSTRMRLHGARALVHFGAQFSWLYALTLIPLVELFALEFTSPIWVALLAPLLIGERLTITRIFAALIGFAGALIVVRPGGAGLSAGTLFALASAIGFALSMIATKTMTKTDSAFKILFWMNALQVGIGAIFIWRGVSNPSLAVWGWALIVAVAGLTAHFSMTRAFAYADSIIVAPMDFLRVPLIALVGVYIYAEPLNPYVLAGGAIVLLANATNLYGERRTNLHWRTDVVK